MSDFDAFFGFLRGAGQTVKEASLDEKLSRIRNAVHAKCCCNPVPSLLGGPAALNDSWPEDVYPEFVIVRQGSDQGPAYFKVPYHLEGNQVIVSDQMIPVEKTWVEKAG